MATLIKEEYGLLYDEYFHESPAFWSLTPSNTDCLRFEDDGLHILHNDKYVLYTMPEKQKDLEEYCLCMRLEHTPIDEEDIAGLIVLSSTDNYAECQTYLASSPSTIGNNGENVTAGYDLSNKYVRYSFSDDNDDEGESENTDSPSSIETVVNQLTGFVDIVYHYIKMIKHKNTIGYTYQFFASPDGIDWIEVGNTDYEENNSIGFFLYATKNARTLLHGKFVVNEFYIYKKMWLTIEGINILQEFEITVPLASPIPCGTCINCTHGHPELCTNPITRRTVLRSDSTLGQKVVNHNGNRVEINTTYLELPIRDAKLRIYPKGINNYSNTIAEYTLDNLVFGGDIFKINYDIKLFIDNEEILDGEVYDLGTLFTQTYRRNIVIYNNENIDLTNIKVSIIAFSEYYSGEEVVQLAVYQGNEVEHPLSYTYSDTLLIPSIESHTGVELVMKLSDVPKQEFYSVPNKYRFKLLIE